MVVPSVPKLVEGSVSNIGKESGTNAKGAAVKAGAEATVAEATVAAATVAGESTETVVTETVVMETVVTETAVTVEETAEATFESSTSIEETGTVWKKKKKD